jgi:hypothetical protein
MSTQALPFTLPLNPKPNASASSSVLQTSNGWTLTVKKTGTDRAINVALKTVKLTLSASHYSAFCGAFQGNSGTKSATVTYLNSTVQSISWDSTTVQLPDGASLAAFAFLPGDASDDARDSSRLA